MPFAELQDDKIIIKTSFVDRHQIREVPGVRYSKKDECWYAPLSWGSCIVLRALFKDTLTVGPHLTAWSWFHFRECIAPVQELRELAELPDHIEQTYDKGLRPFQQVGVRFLSTAQCALLADPMGSGKTAQTIRTLQALSCDGFEVFPALVICPNSVKHTWEQEFKQWWSTVDCQIINGSAAQRRKQLSDLRDVTIINFESMRTHSRLAGYGNLKIKRCAVCDPALRDLPEEHPQSKCENCPRELNSIEWKSVVVDEAHRLKDPTAKQTRAVWAASRGATYRYALTGTPVANNPSDLWSILNFVDPSTWPTKGKYIDRYCEKSYNLFGAMEIIGLKPVNKSEFYSILDTQFRRLPVEVITPQLPPLVHATRYVEMGPRQKKQYKNLKNKMRLELENGVLTIPKLLPRFNRLMQLASACLSVEDEDQFHMIAPSSKIDALEDFLTDLEPDEPLVIFTVNRDLARLASERLYTLGHTVGSVTGDQTPQERQAAVNGFQAGHIRFLVGTIDAAGEGITLTRARKAVRLQRHWSEIKNQQAEKRVHRIGSERHGIVEIIDFLTMDTVESGQVDLLAEKKLSMQEIVRDQEMLLRLLGD